MAQSERSHASIEPKTEIPEDAVVEETDAGGLVWREQVEYREWVGEGVVVGRDLVGFVDVASRQRMRDELRRRGLGVGAVSQLPHFYR